MSEALAAGLLVGAVGGGAGTNDAFEWGLHIAIFDVGQADAIAVVADNGDAAVIDAGHGSGAAGKVADFLLDEIENGVAEIDEVKLGFVTHYDLDHMGGFARFFDEGIDFRKVYDQGPSLKRSGASKYSAYLASVGDSDDDMAADDDLDEDQPFVRRRARVGLHWKLGDARVRVLSARGDTRGSGHDHDLDPSDQDIDENPGSIALLISLGDFEFYTAGDQTSDDWTGHEDTEQAVVDAHAISSDAFMNDEGEVVFDTDIDVLKVNHHGSDTSTGAAFARALDPEVAVVSSKFTTNHRLPKLVSIQQLVETGAQVYVTGEGRANGGFARSSQTDVDDSFTPPPGSVIDAAGDVHIFVSRDGTRYRVFAGDAWREFSAVDAENAES